MPWRNPEPRRVRRCRRPWFWTYLSRPAGDVWVCPRCGREWRVVVDGWDGVRSLEPVQMMWPRGCRPRERMIP